MTKIELAWKWLKPGAAVPVDIKTTTELLDVCKEMAALIENQAAALKTAEDLIAQKDADLAYLRGELSYASDAWSKSRDEVQQKDIQLAVMRGDLLQAGQREDEHMHQFNELADKLAAAEDVIRKKERTIEALTDAIEKTQK